MDEDTRHTIHFHRNNNTVIDIGNQKQKIRNRSLAGNVKMCAIFSTADIALSSNLLDSDGAPSTYFNVHLYSAFESKFWQS